MTKVTHTLSKTALPVILLLTGATFAAGMMMDHSPNRHHSSMRAGGIPEPYNSMQNPIPATEKNTQMGEKLFQTNCASCHGKQGTGDGPAGQALSPRPANLSRFLKMPMLSRDSYLMWTISDGGVKFKTAMPPFKTTLSEEERWKIIHFLRTL